MVVAPSSTHSSGVDRRKWTQEEDALLTRAMARFRHMQEIRWTEIAAEIPDRSAKACRKRWVNGLNERLKKGSWTNEEDDRLREGVAMLSSDWARIADHVGQRSGDQCSKRWREVLDPAINKSTWTAEEDQLLTELFHKHGSAWQIISTHFNNRRALQCRNRCCKLLGLYSYPRARRASVDKKNKEPYTPSPTLDLSSQSNLSSSPTYFDMPMKRADIWPNLNISTPSETPNMPQTFMQDSVFNGDVSLSGTNNTQLPVSPISPIFGLQDVPKRQLMPEPSFMENNPGTNNMSINPWNKIQGFSSLKRKDPPAALNLANSTAHTNSSQPSASQDQFCSPFFNPSPSVCSSISTSPPTPSVNDTLTLQNLANANANVMPPSPMLPHMPSPLNDNFNLSTPVTMMPTEKNLNAINWNLYCDKYIALQNSQLQDQGMNGVFPMMSNTAAPALWFSDAQI